MESRRGTRREHSTATPHVRAKQRFTHEQRVMLTNEPARLDALRRTRLMDTPREAVFDDMAATAAALFHAPMAAITLLGADREWCKSAAGTLVTETARHHSFSTLAVEHGEILIVPRRRLGCALRRQRLCREAQRGALLRRRAADDRRRPRARRAAGDG